MSVESTVSKLGMGNAALDNAPIRPEWVIEGKPSARSKLISGSADGASFSFIWECTAGRFNWHYEAEETIYFLEGSVVIKDNHGVTHRVGAGDTIFFPRGVIAEWHVEKYVRKVAFIRSPVPKPVVLVKKVLAFLRRPLTGSGGKAASRPAIQGG